MTEPASTRKRLIEAGMRLFAQKGFRSTSVGEIETAVGLQPRRGALYKHFPSKHALLEAAVLDHLDSTASGARQINELDLNLTMEVDRTGLRLMMIELGRWFLAEMDRMEDLTHVIEHDGVRMGGLVTDVKRDIVDLSYRTAAGVIAAVRPGASDSEALAVVLLGALVALRRTAWTFGSPPLGLDDDRVLTSWTEVTLSALG
jgi:AcrR family transcriptional regulator